MSLPPRSDDAPPSLFAEGRVGDSDEDAPKPNALADGFGIFDSTPAILSFIARSCRCFSLRFRSLQEGASFPVRAIHSALQLAVRAALGVLEA